MIRGATGVFLVVALVAIDGGAAWAGPKKVKVDVTSDPPGATVYLNLKEDGPVCDATPCTIEAPVGTTPIIVELAGHETTLEELVITKKMKKFAVNYTLVASVGSIVVKGPKGATIRVDDEEKGTAPARIEVEPGTHVVVLLLNDKQISSDAVEVENNGEAVVQGPKRSAWGAETTPGPDDPNENPVDPTQPRISIDEPAKPKPPSAARPGPILVAALEMDVGFRAFRYQNPGADAAAVRPENEGGQVLIGPAIELYPGTLAGVRALRGLAILVRLGFKANSNDVGSTADGDSALMASTYWRAIDVGVRQRWIIADKASLAVGVGYMQELYRFSGDRQDIDILPDAQYGGLHIGARVSLLLGAVEPYLGGETRVIMSKGPLEGRYDQADVSGVHGVVGLAIHAGSHVMLKLEGAITRYSWTFNQAHDPMYAADGATDSIKQLGVAFGLQY